MTGRLVGFVIIRESLTARGEIYELAFYLADHQVQYWTPHLEDAHVFPDFASAETTAKRVKPEIPKATRYRVQPVKTTWTYSGASTVVE